ASKARRALSGAGWRRFTRASYQDRFSNVSIKTSRLPPPRALATMAPPETKGVTMRLERLGPDVLMFVGDDHESVATAFLDGDDVLLVDSLGSEEDAHWLRRV